MEKILLPRGYGRSYDACRYAIACNCDIVAPTEASVIVLAHDIEDICRESGSWEFYRTTCTGDKIHSVIVIRHEYEDSVEIRLYDVRQYLYCDRLERGRKKDVVFDDVDRCMQVLFLSRKIRLVTMECPREVK